MSATMSWPAMISPHSKSGLLFSRDTVSLVTADGRETALSPVEASHWIASHDWLLRREIGDREELAREVDCHGRRTEALEMLLLSLDGELSAELRSDALAEFDAALHEPDVCDWLTELFHACPLPYDTPIAAVQATASQRGLDRAQEWLRVVYERQPTIARCSTAWSLFPDALVGGTDGRDRLLQLALRQRVFSRAVALLDHDDQAGARFLALSALHDAPNHRAIVDAWLGRAVPTESLSSKAPLQSQGRKVPVDADHLRIKGRRPSYDRESALMKVGELKANIVKAMQSGRFERIPMLLDGLRDFHRRYGGGKYAAKSLCDLANEAKALGLHSYQEQLTRQAVEENQKDGWAWSQHGDALLRLKRYDEALRAYGMAADLSSATNGNVGCAEVYKARGQYQRALDIYEQVFADFPDEVSIRNGRAEVFREMGRYAEALEAYDATLARYPEDGYAGNGRAEVLKALGRYGDALAAFDAVIARDPGGVVARTGRAEVLKAMEHYEQALEAYTAIVADHPGSVVAMNARAQIFKAMGNYPRALGAYEDVLAQHPADPYARAAHADLLKTMGRYDDALEAFESAITINPHDDAPKTGRAETFKAMGSLDRALDAYATTLATHPESVIAKNGRAEVLRAMGQYDRALEAYAAVLIEHPQNVVAKNGRAEVLKAAGQHARALDAYDETLSVHPEDNYARAGRAELLKIMGRYEQALDAFDQLILARPHLLVARTGRAEVLKAMGRYDQALDAYAAILQAHPQNVIVRNGHTEVLKAMGSFEPALEAYEATIGLCSDNSYSRAGRAELLKAMGRYEKALDAYDELIAEKPHLLVAMTGRAELLKTMGRYEQSLAAFDAVIAKWPYEVVPKNGRAEVFKMMGRLDEAASAYRAIRARFPNDAFARSGLATVLLMRGEHDQASALLPDASPESQQDWIAWHIRGMVSMRSGKIDDALNVFRHGAENATPLQQPAFRLGLAMALCWRKRWGEARQLLSAVRLSPSLARFSNVIWLHIHAANDDQGGIDESLTRLTAEHLPARVVDLASELRRRYQGEKRGFHPDDWVRQCEVDCFVLAA